MTYSIGEFAKLVGVSPSTLRYYEKEGLITPKRNEHNLREFTEEEIDWVKFLLHLKTTGMTLEELKQYTIWRSQGDTTLSQRLDLLKRRQTLLQNEINALNFSMNILERKINFYEDHLKGKQYPFILYPDCKDTKTTK